MLNCTTHDYRQPCAVQMNCFGGRRCGSKKCVKSHSKTKECATRTHISDILMFSLLRDSYGLLCCCNVIGSQIVIVIPNRDFSVAMCRRPRCCWHAWSERAASATAPSRIAAAAWALARWHVAPPLQMYEQTVPCTHWQVLRCAELWCAENRNEAGRVRSDEKRSN